MAAGIKIEICIDSVASARAAVEGGADRVELCQNLFEGGTTPSIGLIKIVRRSVECPLYVIIRPRGGDFYYSADEWQVIKEDIRQAKAAGADGLVFGVLNRNGTVDRKRSAEMIELAGPLPVTFHRAFDMTRDPFEALEHLIDLGCDRVLTSGRETTVLEGSDLVAELVKKAGRRIVVMPGGGIHERNFDRIRRLTRAREFHLSARSSVESRMQFRNARCFMGKELRPPEFSRSETDARRVREIKRLSG